jgi:redox-sensitive bicupin YhaK (pirin superfamily)
MSTPSDPVIRTLQLGFPWETEDPFLFCVHHDDAYPRGNDVMGPAASLKGRSIGQDFEGIDGWRMYHGEVVPGFPQHPHRGFETVTIARRGYIDHSDSLGATARFGEGDVQWMTAGKGIVHSEMFPLRDRDQPNPVELFQIWLNLPRANKLVDPHFSMFWASDVPVVTTKDIGDRATTVTVIAGPYLDAKPQPPPPASWAAAPNAEVAIWSIKLDPHAHWTLPAAVPGLNRTLYVFRGAGLNLEDRMVANHSGLKLRSEAEVEIHNGPEASELLLLQGRPINEPVAQYGPFVMNNGAEIQQAFMDYRRTEFGGWPWPSNGPVHAREQGRFARHADGKVEERK